MGEAPCVDSGAGRRGAIRPTERGTDAGNTASPNRRALFFMASPPSESSSFRRTPLNDGYALVL